MERTYEIPDSDGEIIAELKARIAELEAENTKLRTTGYGVIGQRDKAAARIAELEEKYAAACDRNQELEGQVAMYWQALTPEQKFDDAYGMLNQ